MRTLEIISVSSFLSPRYTTELADLLHRRRRRAAAAVAAPSSTLSVQLYCALRPAAFFQHLSPDTDTIDRSSITLLPSALLCNVREYVVFMAILTSKNVTFKFLK